MGVQHLRFHSHPRYKGLVATAIHLIGPRGWSHGVLLWNWSPRTDRAMAYAVSKKTSVNFLFAVAVEVVIYIG